MRRAPTLSSAWSSTSWLGAWSFAAARLARQRRPTRLLRPADSDSRPRESPSSPNAVAPDAPSACAALSNPSPSLADFFFFSLYFHFSPALPFFVSLQFSSSSSFCQPEPVLQTFSLSLSRLRPIDELMLKCTEFQAFLVSEGSADKNEANVGQLPSQLLNLASNLTCSVELPLLCLRHESYISWPFIFAS